MDEATSALDQMSGFHVQSALKNIREKKKVTTVTIAHRLSTIVNSDVIAVINNGSIAELGSHSTLLNKENGIYRALCETQGITPDSITGGQNIVSSQNKQVEAEDLEVAVSPYGQVEMGLPASPEKAVEITEEDEEIEASQIELAPMSKIWSYVGKDFVFALIGLIGSGIVGALSPCESILTAQIVTNFYIVDAKEMSEVNRNIIAQFLLFALGSLVGNTMIGIGLSRSGSNLGAKLRRIGFSAMLERSMGWFDESDHTTGELTTILSADAEAVEGLTGLPLGFRVRVLSSIITGVAVALAYSLKIGLVAIACVPLILAAGFFQVICLKKRMKTAIDGPSPPTIMEQGLRGIASVQAYNLESKVGDDYEQALEPESSGKVRRGIVAGFVFGFSQMAIFVSFSIIFYVGTNMLVSEGLFFTNFFTALLSVMFGALGASQVSADFNSRQRGRAGAARCVLVSQLWHFFAILILIVRSFIAVNCKRIFSVLEGPKDGSEDVGDVVPINGDIMFNACQFAFPTRPEKPIYTNLSVDVAQKESIGLVGRSGSGKSTILQIVMRFYEITGGSAQLDGREISDLNVNNLRQQIGYVGQLPTLFNGTVRQNILLGKQDATENQIIAAAKAANAHAFIMNLSKGYDSEVGAGGGMLSGEATLLFGIRSLPLE